MHLSQPSTYRQLCLITLLSGLLFYQLGCQEPSPALEEEELSFGLPGKGDQSCDLSGLLCWVGDDADHARALMNIETEVLLGERDPISLISAIKRLDHKLNSEEQAMLPNFEAQLYQLNSRDHAIKDRTLVIKQGFEQVYGRMVSGYWGAHSTLLSQGIESTSETQGDTKADAHSNPTSIPNSLPAYEGVKPALDTLWSQGPFGQYLVTMLTLTGAHQYQPSAQSIQEREVGLELPIDFAAEQIVSRHSRLAALDSFFSGMVSLIPVAGVYLSVPYGVYMQFKIRVHMSLELGALYGLNPNHPDDYLIIIQSMIAAQGFKELFSSVYKSLLGAQGYRMIADRDGSQYLTGTDDFSERRVDELVKLSLGQLAVYGAKVFETIHARMAGSAMRSFMGQITFGIATLADITIDYLTTKSMGRELRYTLHPWGWATYLESMTELADEEYRRCAHAALIEVARADGDVNELEALLMQEALLRPFHADTPPLGSTIIHPEYHREGIAWTAFIDDDLIIDQATVASYRDPFLCLPNTWTEEGSFSQLSLLSWLELMAHTDGPINRDERELLSELGGLFSITQDEERVYHSMIDRVAAHPRTTETASSALWMWSVEDSETLLRASSDETRRAIWQEMR